MLSASDMARIASEMRTYQALMRDMALARYAVIGPSVTMVRTTAGTPSADPSAAAGAARTAYVVRNAGSKKQQAAAGVGVWAGDWVLVAPLGQDIQATDLISAGGYTFLVTGAPEADTDALIAPVDKQ